MANGTLKVGEITTSTGSGNITIGSGVTLQSNAPAFHVKLSADQSVSDNTFTTVAYDHVFLDTHNGFSTSTYRYTCPTGKSGNYFIGGLIIFDGQANTILNYADVYIYKNTVIHSYQITQFNANPVRQHSHQFGVIMNLSDGDYVEIEIEGIGVLANPVIAG